MRAIIITGASSGIGKALAIEYANKGIVLGLLGRDRARLEAVAMACREQGAVCEYASIDVRDNEALAAWLIAFDNKFPIELVIVNAGITGAPESGEVLERREVAQSLIDVNLAAVVKTTEAVVPLLSGRQSGQIAFVSSLAALRGMALTPVYSATKAGVKAYAEAMYDLLTPMGIDVSLICPGFVESPMSEQFPGPRPFMISAGKAAVLIRRGLEKRRYYIAFPWSFSMGLRILSVVPIWVGSLFLRGLALHKKIL